MSDEELRKEIASILGKIGLIDDGGCGDPECCGASMEYIDPQTIDVAADSLVTLFNKLKENK